MPTKNKTPQSTKKKKKDCKQPNNAVTETCAVKNGPQGDNVGENHLNELVGLLR